MPTHADEFPFDKEIWLISDTHFFHENIGQYCGRPDGWQELIIENWNHWIGPEDIVFHLGDLALGKKESVETVVPLLNGRLFLLRGNHDRRGRAFYKSLGITLVNDPYSMFSTAGIQLLFSHRPIVPLPPNVLNFHGHIHNNPAPELGPCHVNLSIEVRQYRPWKLGDVLQSYLNSFRE